MSAPAFKLLNNGWNADPNAPAPSIEVLSQDLLLRFRLNAFQFPRFFEGDLGIIRFRECSHYRLGETNDEGWYLGQCRYSKVAPVWGEFFEIVGPDNLTWRPEDWIKLGANSNGRHYLFYLRDDTFECFAADWAIEPVSDNALFTR